MSNYNSKVTLQNLLDELKNYGFKHSHVQFDDNNNIDIWFGLDRCITVGFKDKIEYDKEKDFSEYLELEIEEAHTLKSIYNKIIGVK